VSVASKHEKRQVKVDTAGRAGPDRRSFTRRALGAAAVLGCGASAGAVWLLTRGGPPPGPAAYGYEVVRTCPHDPTAFTQGLAFEDGFLYEGTGKEGQSTLRKVELESGRVLKQVALAPKFFGEGITLLGDRIIQLTWRHELAFVYDKESFREVSRFGYAGEGWGLTNDGRHLILSDGSATLRFLDPQTHHVVRKVLVTDADRPVRELNELEYVEGEILANVWHSDRVARIDPESGRVNAWVDFSGLLKPGERSHGEAVLNGIAYDKKDRRLFVTGKDWPKLFEVRIVRAS
jgi:glutamine cyclotransferase